MRILAAAIASLTLVNSHAAEPRRYLAQIVAEYAHDKTAFTQGLFFSDGRLFETTGQYSQSTIREVELKTGVVLRKAALPNGVFGEGSVDVGGEIVVLTWREGVGYVFDKNTFAKKSEFHYQGEGWGLTRGGDRLVMSDGTAELRFLDPKSLQETGRVIVTLRGKPLLRLNELEWVGDRILANIWFTNAIAQIDPKSGDVTGLVDLRSLRARMPAISDQDALNGIAYDARTRRLYVTGKNWPKLFEIKLVAKP